jgi:hypothetical protein
MAPVAEGMAAKKFGWRLNGPDQQSVTLSTPLTLPLPSATEHAGANQIATLAARTNPAMRGRCVTLRA